MIEMGLRIFALMGKLKDEFPEEIEKLGQELVNDMMELKFKKAIPEYENLKNIIEEKFSGEF